jgi:predicted transposase YdaD
LRTDKQLYKIFEAEPEWVFQLTGIPSPGASTLRSLAVKALERKADGVIVPEACEPPLTVIEFQFQKNETIYTRTVAEMVAVQEANQMRPVQGLIFFGYNNLDPQTEPWTRVVRAFLLPELLDAFEREHPAHPLVAVFKPLLEPSEQTLERTAADYYRTIKYSELKPPVKTSLLEVFVNWLEQRLKQKSKKEIEMILLGELPDLEETQAGKDLIRIGEERGVRIGEERGVRIGEERGVRIGEERGLHRAIQVSLGARFAAVPAAMQDKIRTLPSDAAESLLEYLSQGPTLDDVTRWVDAQ